MSNPSDFQQLVDFCKSKAILGILSPSEASQWRYVCRVYSKTFSTPLDQVLKLDPEHVILSFFEEQMDKLDSEDDNERILEMIYELEDPEYGLTKKKAQDEFDKQLLEKEAARLAKGLPIHKAMKSEINLPKNTIEKQPELDPKMPTGGSLNTSLFNLDEEN